MACPPGKNEFPHRNLFTGFHPGMHAEEDDP
jgi:hypothetical protein